MKVQPGKGTKEGNELDMLATLVEAYEDIHYPMFSKQIANNP